MNLTDSFSLFLYAFKAERDTLLADKIWEPSGLSPEHNIYFRHVQDFFSRNSANNPNDLDEACCERFTLKKNVTGDASERLYLIYQLFSRVSTAEGTKIDFRLILDRSALAPALLYNNLTGICILSFAFTLTRDSGNLQNLIELNYKAKTFQHSCTFNIPWNIHEGAQVQEKKLADVLQRYTGKNSELAHVWDMMAFTSILSDHIHLHDNTALSPGRLQCFTYLQTERQLDTHELFNASFRLRRVCNTNFIPAHSISHQQETDSTFEHLHFGASIEGCVIIVNGGGDDLPVFLRDFAGTIKNRYIWSYVLAYFQRLALVDMHDELARLYESEQPELEQLYGVSARLSKIELRTLFTQISFFSQHNDFYEFCKRNLRLNEMHVTLKEKLLDISRIAQQQHEQTEKKREKKKESKDRILEVMIAALLIPELVLEFFSTLAHVFEIKFEPHQHHVLSYFLLVAFVLLMLTVVPFAIRIYKEYLQIIISRIKHKEPSDDVGFKKTFVD